MNIRKVYVVIVLCFLGYCLNICNVFADVDYKVGQYVYYDPVENEPCGDKAYWTFYNQDTTCYRWVIIQTPDQIDQTDSKKASTIRLLLDHDIGYGSYDERATIQTEVVGDTWNDPNIKSYAGLGNGLTLSLYRKYTKYNGYDDDKKNKENEAKYSQDPTSIAFYTKKNSGNLLFLYTNTIFYNGFSTNAAGKTVTNSSYYYVTDWNEETEKYEMNTDHQGGYWITRSNTSKFEEDPGDDYAYYINSSGNIQLSKIKDENGNDIKRGVRPTIYLDINVVTENSVKEVENLKLNPDNLVADGIMSNDVSIVQSEQDHQHTTSLAENNYYYPQGYAFYGEDKFILYMMHTKKKENGVLYDDNYPGVILKYDNGKFTNMGHYGFMHGNDIAYNYNNHYFYTSYKYSVEEEVETTINGVVTKEVVTVNNKRFDRFKDAGTKLSEIETVSDAKYYAAFTFDSSGEWLYGVDSYKRIVVQKAEKFSRAYIIDAPILETLQSISYNNGYLFLVTYEVPKNEDGTCNEDYQVYCYNENRTATLYIYDAHFNDAGEPAETFGQLVRKYTTNNLNSTPATPATLRYEIESVGSVNDQVYLGFAKNFNAKITGSDTDLWYFHPAIYKFKAFNKLSYKKSGESDKLNYLLTKTNLIVENPFEESENEKVLGFKDESGKFYELGREYTISGDTELTSLSISSDEYQLSDSQTLTVQEDTIEEFLEKIECVNCTTKVYDGKNYLTEGEFSNNEYELRALVTVSSGNRIIQTYNLHLPVKNINLDNTSVVLGLNNTNNINNSKLLKADITPSYASNKEVVWTSTNENVAVVDENGKVEAKGIGEATITVTSKDNNNISVTSKVTVVDYIAYKITYNSENHSYIEEYEETEEVKLKSDVTKEGYTLIGWESETNCYQITDTITMPAEDITLTAIWQANEYEVTYDSLDKKFNITYDSAYGELATPTKKEHIFKGWYLEETYETEVTKDTIVKTASNHTLYAKWEIIIPDIEATSDYEVKNNMITKVALETNIKNFDLGLDSVYAIKVINTKKNEERTEGLVATGDKVQIYLGDTLLSEYIISIKGDISGDGVATVADYSKAYQYLKGRIDMEEHFVEAADVVKNDGDIAIADVSKIYQFIKKRIPSLN